MSFEPSCYIVFFQASHRFGEVLSSALTYEKLQYKKEHLRHLQNYQPENSASQYQLPKSHFLNRVERESLFLTHTPISSLLLLKPGHNCPCNSESSPAIKAFVTIFRSPKSSSDSRLAREYQTSNDTSL